MAAIAVTYTFANGTAASATQVNQNFSDIISGLSDGTKDLSISALTCAGTATLNGDINVGNASADTLTITAALGSTIPIKTNNTYDIGSATLGLRKLYIGNGGVGATCDVVSASHATTREYTIPDCGAAASFVMTEVAQTVNGQKTFGSALLAPDGTVSLPAYAFTNDSDCGMYRVTTNSIAFATNGAAVLTFSSGGAIRTQAASGGSGNASSPIFGPSDDTDTGLFYVGANDMGFSTGGADTLHLKSGNVGIGATTSPAYPLEIAGSYTSFAMHIKNSTNTGNGARGLYIEAGSDTVTTAVLLGVDNQAGNSPLIIRDSGVVGVFTTNWSGGFTNAIGASSNTGNCTLGYVASSERFKKDITPITFDTELIYKLEPRSFTWKEGGVKDFGFIAEEVAQIMPDIVTFQNDDKHTSKLAVDEHGKLIPFSVRYSQLTAVLVAELKKLKDRIDALEKAG